MKEEARQKAEAASRKLKGIYSNKQRLDDDETESESHGWQRPKKEELHLTAYEQTIAMEVVSPEDIPVSFEGQRALLSP